MVFGWSAFGQQRRIADMVVALTLDPCATRSRLGQIPEREYRSAAWGYWLAIESNFLPLASLQRMEIIR